MEITLPHSFTPRAYQRPLFEAMDGGCKRAILLWARRHGKDKTAWNYLVKRMVEEIGNYAYLFPTASLARKAAWQNIDKDGLKFLDHIPKELIKRKQDQQMFIELINGSTVVFFGSDRQVSVGTNFRGIILSEYALQDKECFEYLRPVLRENGGWLIIASTPRGKNHYYDIVQMARSNKNWFVSEVTYRDAGVLSEEDIEAERIEGVSEEMICSEYLCDFTRGVEGAFYGKFMDRLHQEDRVCRLPVDPNLLVNTVWDLGISDSTAIIFYQRTPHSIRILDCYENQGEGLSHYINILKKKEEERGWIYDEHYAPQDIKVRELTSGAMTRKDYARTLGVNFSVIKNLPIAEGIENARSIFPKLYIDRGCARLIKALENYCKAYNSKLNVYSDRPVHDWSSHFADCFRYLAIAERTAEMTGGALSVEEWREVRRKASYN